MLRVAPALAARRASPSCAPRIWQK
ncbi:hypothetical protein A2U01_0095398, partial [Trifolium medium]|nr:hypothetical protein [Trifolium medium]